jgi:pimeloyl-ACP methyl ester carboxylesterase
MSVETVPGHDVSYHLVAYGKDGQERPEGEGLYSRVLLGVAATAQPSDVFLFSHGWNGDVPAARLQYGKWLATMVDCAQDRAEADAMPGGFRPLLIGLHWPSKAWGDEELGAASFTVGVETQAPGDQTVGSDEDDIGLLVDRFASRLADSGRTRQALRTIIESALNDPAPTTLPGSVRQAYLAIDGEVGMGAEGVGGGPGDDRDGFDPEVTYQACLQEDLAAFGIPSLGGVLAPLRVLTFWQMKRRARIFGESGAAQLLSALQAAAPAARFHLMGHSFGCIVASAAIAGPTGSARGRRPVNTLVLVQGAMSLWSFCSSIPARPGRPGYFRRVMAEGLVQGPVVTTTSVRDRAVGVFYPLGARTQQQIALAPGQLPVYGGVGTFGIQGADLQIADETLGPAGDPYDFRAGPVYNLDSDAIIAKGGGASGAHSDICHPEVAHAVWQAVTTVQLG